MSKLSEDLTVLIPELLMKEDQELMQLVRTGNIKAYKVLYERFKAPIFTYIFQMVQSASVAEELMQESFLKVYRYRETYEPTAKFSTWLWTIARNTTLDVLRKKAEDQITPEQEETLLVDTSTADVQLIEAADKARVENCMNSLTATQKEALLLRTYSDLSYEEIATTMKTTISSVKSLISRAKTGLLKCLGGSHG